MLVNFQMSAPLRKANKLKMFSMSGPNASFMLGWNDAYF